MRLSFHLLMALCTIAASWAQAPLSDIATAQDIISQFKRVAQKPSLPSYQRTQTAYVVDSFFNDFYDIGTASWIEARLHTYQYYPNSIRVWTDSLFRKSGSNWIDSAQTRYYYRSTGEDSLNVTYTSADGSTWAPTDSVAYLYLPAGSVLQVQVISHEHGGSAWAPISRQRIWYSASLSDSTAFDTFNVNTLNWDEIARGWFKYISGRLDSIHIRANLSGGFTLLSLQKLFYDASNRLILIRDTTFIPSFLAIRAIDEYLFYTSPTSQLLLTDSTIVRVYIPAPGQATFVSRSSYDSNDNLTTVVYEDCSPACQPEERDRYVYRATTVATLGTTHHTPILSGRTGEVIPIPQSWQGAPYMLYALNGQQLQAGLLEANLRLNAPPGLYILRTSNSLHRLYILP